jgi:hypothetical protein
MKVIITPPGEEATSPVIIRMIMLLPLAKNKRWRWRSWAMLRLKPMLLTLYNLPRQMPDDFEFTYHSKVVKHRETRKTTVHVANDLRTKESIVNIAHSAEAQPTKTVVHITTSEKQNLYDGIRRLGFIHFETENNIEVSFDVLTQADYKLTCCGHDYSYSSGTTEPTRAEWSEEELALNSLINNMAGTPAQTQ